MTGQASLKPQNLVHFLSRPKIQSFIHCTTHLKKQFSSNNMKFSSTVSLLIISNFEF